MVTVTVINPEVKAILGMQYGYNGPAPLKIHTNPMIHESVESSEKLIASWALVPVEVQRSRYLSSNAARCSESFHLKTERCHRGQKLNENASLGDCKLVMYHL